MRLARLSMVNWACFKGSNVIEVGAGSYALVAQRNGNPDSSNWCGKSSVLEAIRFVLYGRHRHDHDDDFITDGEELCVVEVALSDSTIINRARPRGGPTKLTVSRGEQRWSGEDAQREVERSLGMSLDDFDAGPYIAQRKTARLVLATPSDFLGVVRDWFQLGKLEAGEEVARTRLRATSDRIAMLRAELGAQVGVLAQHAPDVSDPIADLLGRLAVRQQAVALAERALDAVQREEVARAKHDAEVARRQREAERRQDLLARGLAARDEAAKIDVAALAREHEASTRTLAEAEGACRVAEEALARVCSVRKGAWDGTCPMVGAACPVQAVIIARRADVQAEEKRALEAVQGAGRTRHEARVEEGVLAGQVETVKRLRQRLAQLREEYQRLPAEPPPLEEPDFGEIRAGRAGDAPAQAPRRPEASGGA